MANYFRIEPEDTSKMEVITRAFYQAISEFEAITGYRPNKILITQPLYADILDNLKPYESSMIQRLLPSGLEIMGISTDIVLSKEYYFMIGNPISYGS